MQTAPSVDFPVGRFFISAWTGLALSALSLAGFAWGSFLGHVSLATSLAFLFFWFSLAFATFSKFRLGQTKCWLSWDGAAWRVHSLQALVSDNASEAPAQRNLGACSVQVHLDLQQCLLVSLANLQGQRVWFWVLQKSFPDRWHVFRCAVYSQIKSSIC